MKTVWKYNLKADVNEIEMPIGARLLHADSQFGAPVLWALVDPQAKRTTRRVLFTGTGVTFPDEQAGAHVASFLMSGGQYVFHVFDLGEK